ncbi:MAG: ATP synthase F1 subunit delta [Candidatus Muproteobacteria bacterium RBG_16_60_9]|uniref:ATP synthase subunit delta n=1 Tax=Candidatus Muproteobacteria bacterium RBG_16_60_9 TaxID=1817755 RepID=A0A1F6VKX4_9PROT|nr:MAG: ATP synthase F1 subunit delta [Candidatus Muproteobacteria bacterium RBG_16_60_9]
MAENLTLARPYAEAAFELARAGGSLEPWEQALARMAQVANDPQMQQCIGNPKFSAEQLAQLFIDVSGKLADQAKNFVHVLVDNERLPVLPQIHELFVRLKNAHDGVKQAQVTSAFPLEDTALKKLIAELEPRFKCKLEATVSVDPELIGGVRVAVGDEVIDASVRGKLATMAAALKA